MCRCLCLSPARRPVLLAERTVPAAEPFAEPAVSGASALLNREPSAALKMAPITTTARDLARLYPFAVEIAVATPEMQHAALFPGERAAMVNAIERRRREFTAGRASARRALSALGWPPGELLIGPDRAPIWPQGVTGSISHCEGFCAAVLCRLADGKGLGFDVEPSDPLPEELRGLIYSDSEMSHMASLPNNSAFDWKKVGFSAKEAFYKCYSAITGEFLEFRDVKVQVRPDFESHSGLFSIDIINNNKPVITSGSVSGRWLCQNGYIYTGYSIKNGCE